MRLMGVIAALVLLASVLAFAAPMGKPGPATTAPAATVTKTMTPVVDANIIQKRARVMSAVSQGMGARGMGAANYNVVRNKFMNMYNVMKKTAQMAQQKYQEWYRYRMMYLNGEVNDEVYLQKTKEFITSLITATVERLNALIEENLVDENAQYIVERLTELNSVVMEINDINELRTLYQEEIKPLIEEAKTYFQEAYAGTGLVLMEGAVNQLEVWVQKVLLWAERSGIDANTLQPYIDELNNIKAEILSLKEQYLQGTITFDELLAKLKELKTRITEIYNEIRQLLR
ncbi:MAG: hypothetical protein GXO00_03420 [Candidatus Diapherotrites archaeon]|nr:hypothetical protein [Candidatus Diapherotrites archaeon]